MIFNRTLKASVFRTALSLKLFVFLDIFQGFLRLLNSLSKVNNDVSLNKFSEIIHKVSQFYIHLSSLFPFDVSQGEHRLSNSFLCFFVFFLSMNDHLAICFNFETKTIIFFLFRFQLQLEFMNFFILRFVMVRLISLNRRRIVDTVIILNKIFSYLGLLTLLLYIDK